MPWIDLQSDTHRLPCYLVCACTCMCVLMCAGEDLEMGVVLHRMCDVPWSTKLSVDCGVRIGFAYQCTVPTIVPVCPLHWYDFLPSPLRRRWHIQAHACGEASFFEQRLRSWDPACHAYMIKSVPTRPRHSR